MNDFDVITGPTPPLRSTADTTASPSKNAPLRPNGAERPGEVGLTGLSTTAASVRPHPHLTLPSPPPGAARERAGTDGLRDRHPHFE
jgi:hypothetical protein